VWGANHLLTVATDVTVAEVIGEDEDDVGLAVRFRSDGDGGADQGHEHNDHSRHGESPLNLGKYSRRRLRSGQTGSWMTRLVRDVQRTLLVSPEEGSYDRSRRTNPPAGCSPRPEGQSPGPAGLRIRRRREVPPEPAGWLDVAHGLPGSRIEHSQE